MHLEPWFHAGCARRRSRAAEDPQLQLPEVRDGSTRPLLGWGQPHSSETCPNLPLKQIFPIRESHQQQGARSLGLQGAKLLRSIPPIFQLSPGFYHFNGSPSVQEAKITCCQESQEGTTGCEDVVGVSQHTGVTGMEMEAQGMRTRSRAL